MGTPKLNEPSRNNAGKMSAVKLFKRYCAHYFVLKTKPAQIHENSQQHIDITIQII
jgi:hypothetical protein